MSDAVTAEVAPKAVKTPAAKPATPKAKAVKPAAPKTPAKKTTPKAAPAPKTDAGKRQVVWTPKRVGVLKAVAALKATSAGNARTADDIGKKANETPMLVKDYLYKNNPLVTTGLVGITAVEGTTALGYYLTAKGVKELDKNKNVK